MEIKKVVEYNGRKYRLSKTNPKYYYNEYYEGGKRKRIGLHRKKYIDRYGEIPEGFDIHHIDGDTFNNDISNLDAVERSYHRSQHKKELFKNKEYKDLAVKRLLEAGKKAVEWHKSKEGREWHSENARKNWIKRKPTACICQFCKKEFETPFPSRTKFCGDNCGQNSRYQRKLGFEKRECAVCKTEFEVRKNEITKNCSQKCSIEFRSRNKRLHTHG